MTDYLEAAKAALGDAIDRHQDSDLLHVADTHALIAIAEGLRAILGAIIAIEPEPEPEGWRDGAG